MKNLTEAIQGFWTTTSQQAAYVPLDEVLAKQHADGEGLSGPLMLETELEAWQAEQEAAS